MASPAYFPPAPPRPAMAVDAVPAPWFVPLGGLMLAATGVACGLLGAKAATARGGKRWAYAASLAAVVLMTGGSLLFLAPAGPRPAGGLNLAGEGRGADAAPGRAIEDGWLVVRDGGDVVSVGPGGVLVRSADGDEVRIDGGGVAVRDGRAARAKARQAEALAEADAARAEVRDELDAARAEIAEEFGAFSEAVGDEMSDAIAAEDTRPTDTAPAADASVAEADDAPGPDGLPAWVAAPPAGRAVVVGPIRSKRAAAERAAREAAVARLAELAGVPGGSDVVGVAAIGPLVRRTHVNEITRATEGGNTFVVYEARLLVDVEAGVPAVAKAYRSGVSHGRAGTLAGVLAGVVGLLGGAWGGGRGRFGSAA